MADTSKQFSSQTNYGWGLTFNLSGKAPAVNKRIFNTLADAKAYADDPNDSAIEGLLLSVVSDTEENNGLYFIKEIGNETNSNTSTLKKISKTEDYIKGDDDIKEIIGDTGRTNTITELIDTVSGLTEINLSKINENKDISDNYTINNHKISDNPVLNSSDILINDDYSHIERGDNDFIITGDELNTAIKKIEIMLVNTTLALTAAINDLEKKYSELNDKIIEIENR